MSEPFFKESDAEGDRYYCHHWSDAAHIHSGPVISLERANRLLRERGTVVYGNKDCRFWDDHEAGLPDSAWDKIETYREREKNAKALLINITPIARDSAEKIAEELAGLGGGWHSRMQELIDRARKLKGGV